MCYSAQVWEDYRKYVRLFRSEIGIREFVRLYVGCRGGSKAKIPKAMDAAFSDPQTDDERAIKALIDEFDGQQAAQLEQDIFKQHKRLADAERTLLTKTTKKATEDKRIATDKVAWALSVVGRFSHETPCHSHCALRHFSDIFPTFREFSLEATHAQWDFWLTRIAATNSLSGDCGRTAFISRSTAHKVFIVRASLQSA
jgi:hypothetical protein